MSIRIMGQLRQFGHRDAHQSLLSGTTHQNLGVRKEVSLSKGDHSHRSGSTIPISNSYTSSDKLKNKTNELDKETHEALLLLITELEELLDEE